MKTIKPDHTHDKLLEGQPKPTGEQLLWVCAWLCDHWEANPAESFGKLMERMYGYPSEEKWKAMGAGQHISNVINCAKEKPEVVKAVAQCYL